jgi:hypothetical protein
MMLPDGLGMIRVDDRAIKGDLAGRAITLT